MRFSPVSLLHCYAIFLKRYNASSLLLFCWCAIISRHMIPFCLLCCFRQDMPCRRRCQDKICRHFRRAYFCKRWHAKDIDDAIPLPLSLFTCYFHNMIWCVFHHASAFFTSIIFHDFSLSRWVSLILLLLIFATSSSSLCHYVFHFLFHDYFLFCPLSSSSPLWAIRYFFFSYERDYFSFWYRIYRDFTNFASYFSDDIYFISWLRCYSFLRSALPSPVFFLRLFRFSCPPDFALLISASSSLSYPHFRNVFAIFFIFAFQMPRAVAAIRWYIRYFLIRLPSLLPFSISFTRYFRQKAFRPLRMPPRLPHTPHRWGRYFPHFAKIFFAMMLLRQRFVDFIASLRSRFSTPPLIPLRFYASIFAISLSAAILRQRCFLMATFSSPRRFCWRRPPWAFWYGVCCDIFAVRHFLQRSVFRADTARRDKQHSSFSLFAEGCWYLKTLLFLFR